MVAPERVDAVVIGAGVVGAAVARRLSAGGRSCFVLDRAPRIGGDVTERNSGVIHAGLYYPAGSLKSRLCVLGNRALYAWAARAGVAHARCGKLVVAATEDEEASLGALLDHARSEGVEELEMLAGAALARRAPGVAGRAALYSGTTGIVDPHELTRSLVAAAEVAGAEIVLSANVEAIERGGAGYSIRTTRGTIDAEAVVNAAGLYADEVAASAGIHRYRIHPCRGDYFRLRFRPALRHLVYPVKRKGAPGLGVHLTMDLAGVWRLGPDATYVSSKADYAPAEHKRPLFFEAARRLLGAIREDDLAYDTCGIRPKLRGPDDLEEKDFVIAEDLPRLVNLVGIESPGLTSALAIADEVARMLA